MLGGSRTISTRLKWARRSSRQAPDTCRRHQLFIGGGVENRLPAEWKVTRSNTSVLSIDADVVAVARRRWRRYDRELLDKGRCGGVAHRCLVARAGGFAGVALSLSRIAEALTCPDRALGEAARSER